ncbi:34548_t:CDS:2, partial [Gigaspora margarita]
MLIVSDGRNKINKWTLNVLSVIDCYQDGIVQDRVRNKPVKAHLFEYTTQLIVNDDFNVQEKDNNILLVQIMFCLKEKNTKKLNSHPFDHDHDVGGACGEIKVELGHKCKNLLNPLIASQNFEYKMSNILDKPSESFFGYISVLPGAFSAYRYEALMNGPLEKYLKGESMYDSGATKTGIFKANMYLAEDRILSFELVIKKNESWKLKYIKSTISNPTTDSFNSHRDNLFDAARSLYLVIIVIIFICSMGNRPQGTKLIYTLCIVLFAIIMAFMLYCSIYIMYLTVYKAVPPLDF